MPKLVKGKIKVLYFIHSSAVTGPGRIVYGLVDKISKDEFLCDVMCPSEGNLADGLRKIGARIILFDPKRLRNLSALLTLSRSIRREGYHLLHIHSGQFSAFWKIFGRLIGIPAIIYTEHVEGAEHSWIKGRTRLFLHLLAHPILNSAVDKIIAVSNETRRLFIKRQGVPSDKAVTIYNGVYAEALKTSRVDCASVRAKWMLPKDAFLIGIIARLSPEKGHRFLILAAKEILKERRDVRFVIIGEGPAKRDIEELITSLGLVDYFTLTGFQDDAHGIMGCMDIIVQPSIKSSESFGLTVVEAMAKARPVLASDIECFREIIDDGVDGLLFKSENPASLKDKILLLLSDGDLRKRLGVAAQKKAEERFDIKITAEKTGRLYKETLASKGFIFERDRIARDVDAFMKAIDKEKGPSPDRAAFYRETVKKYTYFIMGRKLSLSDTEDYLKREDNFIIESFLRFIEKEKRKFDETFTCNAMLFRDVIRRKPVTAQDYDERMRAQSLEFQIDNYYEPKDESLKRRIDIVLSFMRPVPGDTVLDVGCGVGTFAYHSAKAGATAYGADYSAASIEVARRLAERFGLAGKVQYVCCDVCAALPYPDGFFDKVVAADFIEHIDRDQKGKLLSEMARILKPTGAIIIFTPNAIREKLGAIKAGLLKMAGTAPDETRLHYGLIDRFAFEKMIRVKGLKFERRFFDVTRPYLARIPILNEVLSLDILWVIKK